MAEAAGPRPANYTGLGESIFEGSAAGANGRTFIISQLRSGLLGEDKGRDFGLVLSSAGIGARPRLQKGQVRAGSTRLSIH